MKSTSIRFARQTVGCGLLLAALIVSTRGAAPVFEWTTLAGRASIGSEDGPGGSARFNGPRGIAPDATGNLYIADTGNHTIRKMTPAGVVSTLAGLAGEPGSVDGLGADARFNGPQGVAVDASGNVYVADTGNFTVRKITPAGVVTTFAGQPGKQGNVDGNVATAQFNSPQTIAVDNPGEVYVGDSGIRRISAGTVQTIFTSGQATLTDGSSTTVTLSGSALAVDAKRQVFFSASLQSAPDSSGLFKLDTGGTVSAVLYPGDWNHYPGGHIAQLAADPTGSLLALVDYVGLDGGQFQIWHITAEGNMSGGLGAIHDGTGADCPAGGLIANSAGEVFFTRDNVVVKAAADGTQTILAGTPASPLSLNSIAVDSAGNVWAGGVERHFMYNRPLTAPVVLKVSPDGKVTTAYDTALMYEVNTSLLGVAIDGADNIYAAYYSVTWPPDLVQIAPSGTITHPSLSHWYWGTVVADFSGDLFVPDANDHVIWKRTPDDNWSVLAGQVGVIGTDDGTGASARFGGFGAITADRSGNLYVVDYRGIVPWAIGGYIRRITPDGTVSTVSGDLLMPWGLPAGLAIDSHGAFYATYGDNRVWRVSPQGETIPVGGAESQAGSADGLGRSARFGWPAGIAVDARDNLYVADGPVIRKGQFAGPPSITTQPQSQTVAAGNSVQFSVTASGVPAPTYQWYVNGGVFSGATTNTLSFTNAHTTDAGDYTVVVTNALGSVTSAKAALTVAAVTTPTPVSDSGGGGGIGSWFVQLLTLLVILRLCGRARAWAG